MACKNYSNQKCNTKSKCKYCNESPCKCKKDNKCNMDKKYDSCKYINLKEPSPCNLPIKGETKYYKEEKVIPGETYHVKNENYYDNYYTKYNDYYVTDVNYVTDHVKEYNVIHKKTKTVYNGSKHTGCSKQKCSSGSCDFCKGNKGTCGSCKPCKENKCTCGSCKPCKENKCTCESYKPCKQPR